MPLLRAAKECYRLQQLLTTAQHNASVYQNSRLTVRHCSTEPSSPSGPQENGTPVDDKESNTKSNPKTNLLNFFTAMNWSKPVFVSTTKSASPSPAWHTKIYVTLPDTDRKLTFESAVTAKRKAESELFACYDACKTLIEMYPHFPGKQRRQPSVGSSKYEDEEPWKILSRHPKSFLYEFFQAGGVCDLPKEVVSQTSDGVEASLTLDWPIRFDATAVRSNRRAAVSAVYWQAVLAIQKKGFLDENFKLRNIANMDVDEFIDSQKAGMEIKVPSSLRERIDDLLRSFKKLEEETAPLQDNTEPPMPMYEHPFENVPEDELLKRNHEMFVRLRKLRNSADPAILNLSQKREQLGIYMIKDEIMNALKNNQVIIVAGDPGCGKTTQVPQFLFDHYTQRLDATSCNIVITQPHCLSAISAARRVASERGESVGDVVGFKVPFEHSLPHQPASVVFMTSEVFLRFSLQRYRLKGISHLIVDEVHSRDRFTDLTLVMVKKLLSSVPDMKLILMSATADTDQLSEYFNHCPVITISGRNFEVEEHFLEDIPPMLDEKAITLDDFEKHLALPAANLTFVADLLTWIHQNRYHGDILCFLPTATDISQVQDALQTSLIASNVIILPCHPDVSRSEEENILEPAPEGTRKIILATDVAETSLVVDNIHFVVNAGLRQSSDSSALSLRSNDGLHWTSKANHRHRVDRAGRVMDGECFHLFTRAMYAKFAEHETPQLQRCSLESILLLTKFLFDSCDPVELLKDAMDPPDGEQVSSAMRLLVELGAFNDGGQLTPLGRRMASLSCHPLLSRALFYANVLGCLEPMISIATVLELKEDIFDVMSKESRSIFSMLLYLAGRSCSMHVVLINLCRAVADLSRSMKTTRESFCMQNDINCTAAERFTTLRGVLASEFAFGDRRFFSRDDVLYVGNRSNAFSNDMSIIKAALMAAAYKNIAKPVKNRFGRGHIEADRVAVFNSNGAPIRQRQLRSYLRQIGVLPNPWFCYFTEKRDARSQILTVDGLTPLPALTAVLFSGYEPVLRTKPPTEPHVVQLGTLDAFQVQFQNERDFLLVKNLRRCIQQMVSWSVLSLEDGLKSVQTCADLEAFRRTLCSLLSDLLKAQEGQYDETSFSGRTKTTAQKEDNSLMAIVQM